MNTLGAWLNHWPFTATGAHTPTATASGTYSLTENSGTTYTGLLGFSTANSFSLTETGSLTTTTNVTGNTVDGSYSVTTDATDTYSMVEHGANSMSSLYTESLTGTATATVVETGNTDNETYGRTTTDTNVYTRTDAGPGAAFSPSSSGTISSTLTETSDARAGVLSQSETGSDRYSLLQNFVNVANTGSNSPGNMDYSTVGEPFSDPGPVGATGVLAASGASQSASSTLQVTSVTSSAANGSGSGTYPPPGLYPGQGAPLAPLPHWSDRIPEPPPFFFPFTPISEWTFETPRVLFRSILVPSRPRLGELDLPHFRFNWHLSDTPDTQSRGLPRFPGQTSHEWNFPTVEGEFEVDWTRSWRNAGRLINLGGTWRNIRRLLTPP